MFELRALCTSPKCGRSEFHMLRRDVLRKSTSGQPYTISQVVCPKCSMWAEVQDIKEVSEFHGQRYWYPTPGHGLKQIGVCQVLGGVWAVCWINPADSTRVRVKSSNLPVLADPDAAQRRLDEWAVMRKLREVG